MESSDGAFRVGRAAASAAPPPALPVAGDAGADVEVIEYLDGTWNVSVWLPHGAELCPVVEKAIGALSLALASASSGAGVPSPGAASGPRASRRRCASDAGRLDAA